MNQHSWVATYARSTPPTASASAPALEMLRAVQSNPRLSGIRPYILRLTATPTIPDKPGNPSHFTRHNTALKLSWMCYQEGLSEEICLELMMVLWEGMEQPPGDEYTPAMIERMVRDTYKSGKTAIHHQPTNMSPWTTTLVPFEMPYIDPDDPGRVRKLWDKRFAAIPVPNGKGSSKNPTYAHLRNTMPTDQEWAKFAKGWYKRGNAALLFGNENPGTHRLYVIEVEHWEDFWGGDQIRRDYFLANTPVMISAKSAHIFLMSDEIVHSTKVDGVVEFRGSNNYSMAPGSIHPSSTPEKTIVYQVLNSMVDTILKVSNVPAFVHSWFPLLFPSVEEGRNVPTSRTPPYIRDVGTFVEQDASGNLEHVAPPPSVAQQAAALAGNYRDAAIRGFPQDPRGVMKGGSKAVRRKDDHKHLAIHSGSSDTWQEPNNAALKRRKVYQFYSPLLWDIIERQNMGAIYQFRYHLSPETVKEDAKYTSNLHSRIRRHHGNYVDFLIQEEDGWWVHTFSDYADNFGNTEPIVAAQEDFLGGLQGLGPPDAEYRRRYPVMASEEWKMPKSRTHEWESLGSRSIPDILHYKDIEDREDAEAAAQRGITTWLASEAEVMGRAPEEILTTRHFQGGETHSARFMLAFLKNDLGFFLYPKAMAELEAPEPNTAPWEHQKGVPPAPKQARLAV